jgi:hypothetical protein
MSKYIVMHRAAKMPNTCMGQYRRVAVVEVDGDSEPKMISERARGVVRIIKTWERLNVGTTDRCAFHRAMAEAREMAGRLNNAAA